MTHRQPPPALTALVAFPAAKLLLHLASFRGYGYFRDELYYLACADHMAWGYVDHPPLCVAILWLVRQTLGDSLFAIRLVPAIAGAATVLLVGLLTRRLGGDRLAQTLAMTATLVAPQLLSVYSTYSMNGLDVTVWTAAAYLLTRALQGDDEKPGSLSASSSASAFSTRSASCGWAPASPLASCCRGATSCGAAAPGSRPQSRCCSSSPTSRGRSSTTGRRPSSCATPRARRWPPSRRWPSSRPRS